MAHLNASKLSFTIKRTQDLWDLILLFTIIYNVFLSSCILQIRIFLLKHLWVSWFIIENNQKADSFQFNYDWLCIVFHFILLLLVLSISHKGLWKSLQTKCFLFQGLEKLCCNKRCSTAKQNPSNDWYIIIILTSFKQTKISQLVSQLVKSHKTGDKSTKSISEERYQSSAEVKSWTQTSRTTKETPSMPYGTLYQSKWGVKPSRPLRARGGQITHERMLIGLKQRHMTTVNWLLKAKRETEERFAPGRIAVQRSTTGWNNTLAERRNLPDKSTGYFDSERFWKLSGGKKEISTIELWTSAVAKKSSKPERNICNNVI